MSAIDETGDPDSSLVEEYLNDDTVCTICQAEFLDEEDLQIHLDQVHKTSEIPAEIKECDFCDHMYGDLMSYAAHIRDFHILSLSYCNYCLRAFDDQNLFKEHESKHKSGSFRTLHSCWKCEKRLTLIEMREHDIECHRDDKEGVIIQELFPYLSSVLKVKVVAFIESIGVDTMFICVGCEYSTSNIETFIHHARKVDCYVVVCNKCSNVYKNKKNLARHLSKECWNGANYRFKTCTGCDTMVPKSAFQEHKKVCTVIKCFTCNQKFVSMYKLTQHQATAHPLSVELKRCKFCWKQCVGNFTLRKHIEKSHKHELHLYKYLCIYCKNMYKHPQKLLGHFFGSHKDIFPYTCKICDLKFKLRKRFTIHIKLEHKSIGFVEFDENYHVFFTEKKSENPFIPKSLYVDESQGKDIPTENTEDVDLNSDAMNATETEANQTEVEEKPKQKPKAKPTRVSKRKRTMKTRNKDMEYQTIQSSDDEPLLEVKRKCQKAMPKLIRNNRSTLKTKIKKLDKKRLTCKICNKYCYTIQNYNHHVSLHSKTDVKKCIKCGDIFRSKEKLDKHMASKHSSSKLTETLKTMLEKRKEGKSITDDLPMSEKFRRTIKKTALLESVSPAIIKQIDTNLSVQKFIENFTPDIQNESKNHMKKEFLPVIQCDISVKAVSGKKREPIIKMTKFIPKPIKSTQKLAMPVKFKDIYKEKTKISVQIVQPHVQTYEDTQDDAQDTVSDHFDDHYDNHEYDDDKNVTIPDVAEEIETVSTVEAPKPPLPRKSIQQKIVIPQLPNQLKDVRIAHLLPQAPFYKIVKVNEVLNADEKNKPKESTEPIKLPDGTKLITANPLAHLLGDTPVEKVLAPSRNKYYKPINKNYKSLLAKALSSLDKPSYLKKKKRKKTDVSSTADSCMVDSTSGADSSMIDSTSVPDSSMVDMIETDSSMVDSSYTIDTLARADSPITIIEVSEANAPTDDIINEDIPPIEAPSVRVKPSYVTKKKRISPKSKMALVSVVHKTSNDSEIEEDSTTIEIGHDMPVIEATD